MKMKKIMTFLTCMLLILCMAACSTKSSNNDKTAPDTKPEKQSQEDNTSEPDDSVDPTVTSGKKTLVVYYSASGNTESIANYIASATNGDIMELVPADDYTSEDLNYSDDNSRVVYEHDHPEARNIELVKNTVDNWEEYDTVFIGYPIWWHIAAWPVDGFVKANDFTGKTVIPFCTSASSGLGESGSLLADMAGTGNWLEGQRFSSGASAQTVSEWVESLNLGQ